MARWEPGTAERLQKVAAELFVSRGFEQTTAADIAHAAGPIERTFFRHFGRDVLVHGQETYVGSFTEGVHAAPPSFPPATYIRAALESASRGFTAERREFARSRQIPVVSCDLSMVPLLVVLQRAVRPRRGSRRQDAGITTRE